jgi:hypothetical protein
MVTGSARNVRLTNPPNVAAAQAAKKTTKNAAPRPTRTAGETGARGLSG